jgi:serine/threonine protein phosphatase PrpC
VLPLIGLLLFSLSLLILWSAIVLGISQTIVHLWSASHQQEHFPIDHDESAWDQEQQAQPPSQAQPRLQSAHTMNLAFTPSNRYSEPQQYTPQLLAKPQSRPKSQMYQLQQPQQMQPLRGAVPTYEPAPPSTRPYVHHTGAQFAHLQLIPEQLEPAQNFAEDSEDEEWFAEEQDIEELNTRPMYGSEDRHTARNEDDDEQEATLRLVIGIGLDPGLVRKDRPNEDSLFAIQGIRTTENGPVPAGLFVIADGMGGHANGGDASRLAVREISNIIVPALLRDDSDDSRDEHDEQEFLLNLLKDGVHRANLAIHQQNRAMSQMMGTTITTALVVDTTAYIVNVGDSRTYLYRAEDGLVQITRDHSTVARLVEQGEIKRDEIYTHPQRNQIYRCLGEHPTVEMDTFVVPLQPDDILLLCSDGVWEMVRDPAIEKIVASSSHLPAQISNILVQAALDGGGADNISTVVVGVVLTTL